MTVDDRTRRPLHFRSPPLCRDAPSCAGSNTAMIRVSWRLRFFIDRSDTAKRQDRIASGLDLLTQGGLVIFELNDQIRVRRCRSFEAGGSMGSPMQPRSRQAACRRGERCREFAGGAPNRLRQRQSRHKEARGRAQPRCGQDLQCTCAVWPSCSRSPIPALFFTNLSPRSRSKSMIAQLRRDRLGRMPMLSA
jgi:hypothetical protein